jgi:parallel beta-helix repeat protein
MKRKSWGLLLLVAVLSLAQPIWGDDLYVIAVGGGVGKPISSVGQTISQPGFYYLKVNLSSTGSGNAITIAASEVTLDLMGFSITGPGSSSGTGVYVNSGVNNVEVRNGSVKSFLTGIISDFSGAGSASKSHRLANLKVSGCGTGIKVSMHGPIVTGCQATNNTIGFHANSSGVLFDKNTATSNTTYGFYFQGTVPGIIINNIAYGNGTGFSFTGSSSQLVDRNSSYGNTTANWSGLPGCTTGLNTP